MRKYFFAEYRSEKGASEPTTIIGLVVVFAVLYYGGAWILDFMKDVKQDRKVARGFEQSVDSYSDGPKYMSDLY